MSFNLPIRSFDSSIVNNIIWLVMGYAFSKGMDFIIKQHSIKFNQRSLWRKYHWSRIALYLIGFVILGYFSFVAEKLHFRIADRKLTWSMIRFLFKSYLILQKIEPELAYAIYQIVTKHIEQWKINQITGVDKNPDFSDTFDLHSDK